MFDTAYRFEKIGTKPPSSEYIKLVDLYRFKTEKRSYICEVELYSCDVFIIKFYDRADKNNPHKYSKLTGDGNASKIIKTCLDILASIYKNNTRSSFGFIGANMETESLSFTKRYKVYSKVSSNLFGRNTFEHVYSDKHSAYLFANKCNIDIEAYINECKHTFTNVYPNLDF